MIIVMSNNLHQLFNFLQMLVSVGGVCVVLPIWVVTLVMKARTRKMDRKMDILMASVEKGQQVDPALLVAAEEGNGKYKLKRNILNRLAFGSIFSLLGAVLFIIPVLLGPSTSAIATQSRNSAFFVIGAILLAVGAGLLISYFVGRKMLAKEIEAEEAELAKK